MTDQERAAAMADDHAAEGRGDFVTGLQGYAGTCERSLDPDDGL